VKESHIKSIIGTVREIVIINSLLLLKEHVIQIIIVTIHIVSDLILDTNSAVEKELSTHFEKKLTKLNNITAVPFKVTKHSPISERKPYKINNWHSQRNSNNKFSSTPKRARYSNNNSNNSHRK
jgi:hypothetical protein